jgi:hypothetical protein
LKSSREMAADTEAYREEVKKLVETDPEARIAYQQMKAELAAAKQVRDARKHRTDAEGGG